MQNKIANFWIRFLGRIIDFAILGGASTLIAWPNLEWNPIRFLHPYNFYIWCASTMIINLIVFIIIPLINKGQTIGMWITKIKIEFIDKDHKIKSLLKREVFISLLWEFNLLMLLVVINHTLANRFFKSNSSDLNYTVFENFRISLFTTLSSFGIIGQFIVVISTIIKKEKGGLHDSYSKTRTVWVNKKVKIISENKIIKSFKPHIVSIKKIKWKDQ